MIQDRRLAIRKMLHVTREFQVYHDHSTFDPATQGEYIMRLPNGLPVPITSFERRKQELLSKMDIR